MFDLHGIARQLHLSVDQIRHAAELLDQGYAPTFISRYRADETGSLSSQVLWRLKLYIDRMKRLESARQRVSRQLPKDVNLDSEAEKSLANARSIVAIDSILKSFRSRRALEQSQEKETLAGRLLEAMITYTGPSLEDLPTWAGQQVGGDAAAGSQALSQVARLTASLMQCDTALISRLRSAIQRRATLKVEDVTTSNQQEPSPSEESKSTTNLSQASSATPPTDSSEAQNNAVEADLVVSETKSPPENQTSELEASQTSVVNADETHDVSHDELDHSDIPGSLSDESDEAPEEEDSASEQPESSTPGTKSSNRKGNSKLTPRQRRRRWLISLLSPLRSINKPLNKLTAYQQLMLGRGVRSQLIKTPLAYDVQQLVDIARDSFVESKHPLAAWFSDTAKDALDNGLRIKLEAEAIHELEEEAAESLLEHATDELRTQLVRRPVRGHTIALIDTIGPKTVVLVIVDPNGNVLKTDELPCSAQPDIVNQNIVKLGELLHQNRVTLVAITNGPARRFMVVTLRELMIQSQGSNLRWTMADRSAADAYAGGRIGLRELATYNRRERAAIWAARYLQNPLVELLKVEIGRLRLGSYQCELPKEALRQLVVDTIADCICNRGIDTLHASESELQYIPGVGAEQAKQIAALAESGKLSSRSELKSAIADWPEMNQRQAIGWLRVFGSTNPLDATLIHPEDYRLAERLIENTELSAPPSSPPGWIKRSVVQSEANAQTIPAEQPAANTSSADTLSSEIDNPNPTSEPIAAEENIEADTPVVSSDQSAESLTTTEEPLPAFAVDDSVAQTKPEIQPLVPSHPPEYPEDVLQKQKEAAKVDAEKLANQWQVGRAKLKTIAAELQDPFGDPRLDGPPVPLSAQLPTLGTLSPGDCVWAIVVGVADFGAFVELAPNCNGLVHISRLSPHYIEDPHQSVQVGDLIMAWVVEIDQKKHRASLTTLSPAQRVQAESAAQQRKAQQDQERQRHDRGPRRDHASSQGGQQGRSRGDTSNRTDAVGSRVGDTRGARGGGGQRGPQPAGGRTGGQPHSGRQRAGGDRGDRSGSHQGRGRRGGEGQHNKSVVVTSKKPIAPISQAMKQGAEPLRSFSDLMQFYESKRTDDEPVNTPVVDVENQQADIGTSNFQVEDSTSQVASQTPQHAPVETTDMHQNENQGE